MIDVRNLKDPPATSKARPTTSEGAWAFFSDNAAMPTIHIQISSILIPWYIVQYSRLATSGVGESA